VPQARWERRFTATTLGFPVWARERPDRLALISNRSGSLQIWTHDLQSGAWRQVTDDPVGIESVLMAPDGRLVWWFDRTGNEHGHWVTAPFEGSDPEPLMDDVPDAWSMGISITRDRIAIGIATEDGYRAFLADGDEPARLVYADPQPAGVGAEWPEGVGGLSHDGALLCIRHSEDGDILRHALRVIDAGSGRTICDLADPGRRLAPVAWSPSERVLAFVSEQGAFERPGLWNPETGERRDLPVPDLRGAVFPIQWYPDGSALLVRHEHRGRAQLHRLDVSEGKLELIADPGGDIDEAALRPDGAVWMRTSDSTHPPRIVDADGSDVVTNPDESAPTGRRFRDEDFSNGGGDPIHGFVVTPPGPGPFPTVMSVHGGPEWNERDAYDPETQAFVDAGYAVSLVNYRGSTGYGIAFREALVGDPALPESEDVTFQLDKLIADGIADPERVFWSGWSWGGCLACLNAGLRPDRWRAIFAGIPAGDFVAAHWASSPALQAWDDAIYGGSPDEVPEVYRERDPMTYADRVITPTLIIAGENDSRCPLEGITPWVEVVRSRGIEVKVHLYGSGHHANSTRDRVEHMRMILDFFAVHGGPKVPDA
jgi:dipeptidyl aminopeptidase/acylaminoacyl peptidase